MARKRIWRLALLATLVTGLVAPATASANEDRRPTATANGDDVAAYAGDASDPSTYVEGEVLVKYRSNRSEAARAEVRSSVGALSAQTVSPRATDVELLTLPAGTTVAEAVAELRLDPDIAIVEPNYRRSIAATSNDPRWVDGTLWNMQGDQSSPANAYGSQAAEAWAAGYTGSSDVYVAVLDEGIDISHPDLAGNIWTNPYEIAGNGLDEDGNGYIDDVHGWDFVGNDNNVVASDDSHGSHVAGTIGAVGGNAVGVAGVAWDVTLISARILGPNGGSSDDMIAAIDYVIDLKKRHGINIVATNNSYGGGQYSALEHHAVERSGEAGILFVAAAGNDGTNNDNAPMYPASYVCDRFAKRSWDCVVSVASIGSSGAKAATSNYGASSVDLGAPGVDVYSTVNRTVVSGGYATYSGTSMAAPHVAGAIALCASSNRAIGPESIRAKLMSTAIATPSLSGITSTGRRLDVGALVASCSQTTAGYSSGAAYICASSTYAWVDAVTGGSQRSLDDESTLSVPVGFTFNFYGAVYSSVWVNSNGFLGLGERPIPYTAVDFDNNGTPDAVVDDVLVNQPLPRASHPNGGVFAFWDDLDPGTPPTSGTAAIWTKTIGSAPNRTFVTTWSNVPHYVASGTTGGVTFQAILYESTGSIKLQYQDVSFSSASYDNGASATIGIEAPSGVIGTQVSHNSATRSASTAVTCSLSSPPTITTTSLPGGNQGVGYSQTLAASGGTTPYSWSLASGSLPGGLGLSSSGVISGTPTTTGTSNFTVRVTDAASQVDEQALSITVTRTFSIVGTFMPSATSGRYYLGSLDPVGNIGAVSWQLIGGTLPPGFVLYDIYEYGWVEGTTYSPGLYTFTVLATDSTGATATATATLKVHRWLDGPGRFVDEAFVLFTGQLPSAFTNGYWSYYAGIGDRYRVTSALAVSDGWAGYEIDQLYQIVLGRGADPSGRAYWVSQVAAGVRLETIAVYYYGGPEYYGANGNTPTGYVTALYQDILHRQPDPSGLNFWVGMLNAGALDRYGVAASFYASIESRRDRVNRLYQRILGRAPDPGGWDYWAGQLLNTGDVSLAVLLAGSDEYYARATR